MTDHEFHLRAELIICSKLIFHDLLGMNHGGVVFSIIIFSDFLKRERGNQMICQIHRNLSGERNILLTTPLHKHFFFEIIGEANLLRDHIQGDILTHI